MASGSVFFVHPRCCGMRCTCVDDDASGARSHDAEHDDVRRLPTDAWERDERPSIADLSAVLFDELTREADDALRLLGERTRASR